MLPRPPISTRPDTLCPYTTLFRLYGGTRVDRNGALDTGADQRLLGTQARYGLALHVGAHQCAVRVVVLKEWNQRSCDGYDLRRRDVHVMHVGRCGKHGLASLAARDRKDVVREKGGV